VSEETAALADRCLDDVTKEAERQGAIMTRAFLIRAALRHATHYAVLHRVRREEFRALEYAAAAEELAKRYERETGERFDWHSILPQ
jgi:type IV secretory pathway ATPase VirB11/archaellum biosynthesis ATPase